MDIRAVVHKHAILTVLAVCAGYVGSALHGWVKGDPETVRAERFEVVDASKNLLSFWGPDDDPGIHASTPRATLLAFMNAKGQRGCELGSRTGDQGPTLRLYDRNRKERVRLYLGDGDDPVLGFSGSEVEGTVLLGAIEDDAPDGQPGDNWALRLRSGSVRSGIGASKWYDGRYTAGVTVMDEEGKYWNFPPEQRAP